MRSWNELFHEAENPDGNSTKKTENFVNFVGLFNTIERSARFLIKSREDGQPITIINLEEHLAGFSEVEKKLLSGYLLRLAEFYQIDKEYGVMKQALNAADLLAKESGKAIYNYDNQSN